MNINSSPDLGHREVCWIHDGLLSNLSNTDAPEYYLGADPSALFNTDEPGYYLGYDPSILIDTDNPRYYLG